jgi:hypothetical protein
MKRLFFRIILLILIIVSSFSLYFYLNGNFRLLAENGLINYLTLSRTVYKEIDSIDEKLRGTTSLNIVIKFKAIEKPKIKNIDSKAKDDFDEFENEFAKTAKENQYWFTQDKMNTIITIHNYLETIPQIGNVQSLSNQLIEASKMEINNYIQISRNCIDFSQRCFDEKTHFDELNKIYQNIIKKNEIYYK